MTSVVDKYHRRIVQNIDNVTMKFDISGLLVKSKEHDSKIENNKNTISQNLTLINSKSNIIEDNKNNIAEVNGKRHKMMNLTIRLKTLNETISFVKS